MISFMDLKQMDTRDLKDRLAELDVSEHRLKGKKIFTGSIQKERETILLILKERKARRKRR